MEGALLFQIGLAYWMRLFPIDTTQVRLKYVLKVHIPKF